MEENRSVYSVFVGDGDSKSSQHVNKPNPYPLVSVRIEQSLAHVAKRLKKNMKQTKRSTKETTYVQH